MYKLTFMAAKVEEQKIFSHSLKLRHRLENLMEML